MPGQLLPLAAGGSQSHAWFIQCGFSPKLPTSYAASHVTHLPSIKASKASFPRLAASNQSGTSKSPLTHRMWVSNTLLAAWAPVSFDSKVSEGYQIPEIQVANGKIPVLVWLASLVL